MPHKTDSCQREGFGELGEKVKVLRKKKQLTDIDNNMVIIRGGRGWREVEESMGG